MEIVQGLVDVPLSIDSSVTAAIEAALKVAKGRPLINSVTGEEEKLEAILPLCKKYDVPVVAISNDETGISEDPDVRFAVAKKIVERAAITASSRTTSSLIRSSCDRRHGYRRPAGLRAAAPPARELKVNTPAASPTSPSACRNRHGINAGFIPWSSAPA